MKVALIGAGGFIGSAILKEAAGRGQSITTINTDPAKIPDGENLTKVKGDVMDTDGLTDILRGHEAVISAFSGHAQKDIREYYEKGMASIIQAVKDAGVSRLLIVGGAGSLEVAPGVQLLDTPDFPAAYKPTAEGARTALNMLKQEQNLDWTMLSPAAIIFPGPKTGTYRLAENTLITAEDGSSRISTGDYAKAMIDELENPSYRKQRFTVGY